MEKVIFFDTTCRDGKQAPGNNHGPAETVRIARQASKLGINVFEAGFAVSSDLDFACVSRVAKEVPGIVPCSLTRAVNRDIEAAAKALEGALESPRIHTFIATSDIHLRHKLQMNRDQALKAAVSAIEYARQYVSDVEFSAEDAMRTDFEYLKLVVREAVLAGANTINLPDTVGYVMPDEMRSVVSSLLTEVPEITERGAVLSVHCHNDLGCATANTLAGILGGARQVECSINGIGERAGNTHFAEVAMALRTRPDFFELGHSLNTEEIGGTACLVSSVINKPLPDNLPIVGKNVFAHGSGIHQHGVSGHTKTYEIMTPASVGWNEVGFPLSSQSGRQGLKERLGMLGYKVIDEQLPDLFEAFKKLAINRDLVSNNDLHLLMQEHVCTLEYDKQQIELHDIKYQKAQDVIETTVVVKCNGKEHEGKAQSVSGPVDAAKQALSIALCECAISLKTVELMQYDLGKGHGGTDAKASAHVAVTDQQLVGFGSGEDPDIVLASVYAYLQAVNHLLFVGIEAAAVDV